MKITVRAKPGSSQSKIEKISETEYIVWVKEPPINGLANNAILNAIASHFNVKNPRIIKGYRSFTKIILI